ncbi:MULTISPECIES: hypothetical protein [Prosthecochloris]|uniref:Uncharacterized protein n=1 Tax=Prosthecochloris vibrioformis TaxID=1098 RepID=A0A5C4S2C7_PROVB|nr:MULTISPECIES: hypothetical protein [Prosthecochloris]ANT63854.1 hypothetical protein Ptc2401_00031 [Prosthecochloris sp. CIB 2401]TNJ37626.1 hypothetical protein FGF68_00110 [Prosthecochloris vibrioformis]
MIDDLIRKIEKAVEASENWPEKGWPVTFGPRNIEVPDLKAAEALPREAVYRQEALNYWRQVRLTGGDTAAAGRKALEALRTGRLQAAADALYLCQYLEKPFEGHARTWIPLYEEFREFCIANN